MITSPENAHLAIAAGAADAASLLAVRPGAPPLSAVEIGFDHDDNRARARCQLGPATTSHLAALLAWADELDEVTVTARRFTAWDPPFTSVAVHTVTSNTAVQVWAHPDADEVAALWRIVGHEPASGVTAPITLDVLRAAWESCQVADETTWPSDETPHSENPTENDEAAP